MYTDYMYKFGITELKQHLGDDIVETLIEWLPNGDLLLTRDRLIKMINTVHGNRIFKKPDFRRDLLMSMDEKSIFEIRDHCLLGKEKAQTDPMVIVETIVGKPWKNNSVSNYLAKLWELPDNIFEVKQDDSETCNIVPSGERFFELLDYQYYVKQRVLNNLNSGNEQERMLVHMPTGTGKTKTSMHTIVNYMEFSLNKEGLIIWVAHTTELLQQAYDTFKEVWGHLGDGELKAYKLWGSHELEIDDKPLNGIVFCGLSKLMSIYDNDKKTFDRLHSDCRLVVFDEAHKAAATKTKQVIESLLRMPEGYENRALIGLTATPGRTTAASYNNDLLADMFGNKLISIDSRTINQINMGRLQALNTKAEENIIRYFQERKILAGMSVERLKYRDTFTQDELKRIQEGLIDIGDDRDFTAKQLEIFAKNKDRNKAIMDKLKLLNEQGKPTIVFACSVNHAKMLSSMLTLEDIKNSLVIGDMDPIERKEAIEVFKDRKSDTNIIINYEVLTTGFDSKNIQCVFITRPTQSVVLYSQMLGRGLRGPLMGGNESCLLVDIDDNLEQFNNEMAFSHFDDYWKA